MSLLSQRLLTCLFFTMSLSAWAAPSRPAAPVQQEIYPATESETTPPTAAQSKTPIALTAPVRAQTPLPALSAKPKQAAGIVHATAPVKPAPTTTTTTLKVAVSGTQPPAAPRALDATLAYDLVPSDQVDPLAKRLQLVEILIRKYSRAYDYRTHTVRELEAILAKLDLLAAPTARTIVMPPAPKQVVRMINPPETTATASTSAPMSGSLPQPTEEDEINGGQENPHNTDE